MTGLATLPASVPLLTREAAEVTAVAAVRSYILLRNKLQCYHVDKVIMSVSRTDEERTKMRSQSSLILLQTMSFSANSTEKFNVGL